MSAGPSDQVAESFATDSPAVEEEAAGAAERVEQEVPPTAVPAADARSSWADVSVSEPTFTPPPSDAAALEEVDNLGIEVKAEGEGVDTTQQVLDILGAEEGVADFVATDQPETSEAARPFLEPETSADVEPTQAFDDIDKAKEEVDFAPTEPSGVSELAAEVETTDLLGLEETAVEAEASAEASDPVDPKPEVAEPLATDPSEEIQAPPTSPNLVPPGVEPIQTGHTPATGSRPPRHRSSRGGQTTRWQEASRNWYQDFDKVRYWLFHNSGGEVNRGFWLRKYSLSEADRDQRWFVSLFEGIKDFLDRDDCLILCYYIWPTYSDWVHQNGLDRRRGLAHGRALVEAEDLPPKRIINRGVLGVENPDDSVWDRYYRYQGVNQQPLPKATGRPAVPPDAAQSAFVEPTAKASAPAAIVPESSSRQRSKSRRPADAEQPSTGWIPSLRAVDHPVASDGPQQQPKKKSSSPKPAAGVAVSGRDTTVSSSSAGASPKAPKAKVDTPKASQVSSVGTPVAKVGVSTPPSHPPPGNLVESSSASAPPPAGEPPLPAPSIPPPPQEPPPTREELAERAAQVAREDPPPDPEDPKDPPDPEEEPEGDWVEEEEEEEPQEDQAVEREEAEPSSPQEPEFPDFGSPRSRRHKRPHSNPPVPTRLLTRKQREDLEIQQQIFQAAREIRARPATGLTRRGIVLQPAVPGYPETRIDSTGMWARIAGPPVAFAAQPGIRPFAIPAGEDIHINDIYSVPDTYWRNPSLHSRAVTITDNLGPADVVNVAVNDAETESEGEESPTRARARFDEAGHRLLEQARQAPIEADPLPPHRPKGYPQLLKV
eukprot:s750_g36.t1